MAIFLENTPWKVYSLRVEKAARHSPFDVIRELVEGVGGSVEMSPATYSARVRIPGCRPLIVPRHGYRFWWRGCPRAKRRLERALAYRSKENA